MGSGSPLHTSLLPQKSRVLMMTEDGGRRASSPMYLLTQQHCTAAQGKV